MSTTTTLTNIQSFKKHLCQIQAEPTIADFDAIRDEWITLIASLLKDGEYDAARQIFSQILFSETGELNKMWMSTKTAVLYRCFCGYDREKAEGVALTFHHLTDPDQMVAVCFELKTLLWRIEFGLPEPAQQEIVPVIRSRHVGVGLLIEMVQNHVLAEDRIYVANKLCILMAEEGLWSFLLPTLMYAYELDPEETDSLFHLCYTLYRFGEYEVASELLESAKKQDPRMQELSRRLQVRIPFEPLEAWDGSLPAEYSILSHLKPFSYDRTLPSISIPDSVQTITGIVCVNDERKFAECALYWQQLKVPQGYQTRLLPIREAESLAGGYQSGMEAAEPGIKIYLHQDLFLTDPYILYDLLAVFNADSSVGIVGIAGTIRIPDSCVWWDADQTYYELYQDNTSNFEAFKFNPDPGRFDHGIWQEAKLLDGVLLATRQDLPWRKEDFGGWHFYDLSQCAEFQIQGYKAAIAHVEMPCAIHATNCTPEPDPAVTGYYYSREYDFYRRRFQEIYRDWIQANRQEE